MLNSGSQLLDGFLDGLFGDGSGEALQGVLLAAHGADADLYPAGYHQCITLVLE